MEVIANLDNWDAWEDAELMAALTYIRGSKGLKVPAEWRGVVDSF